MVCANCRRGIAENSNFCYFCGARQSEAPQMPPAAKRLMRSATNQKLAGVCAGCADYLGVDPTLVRLLWAVITFFTGFVFGILAYLVAWFIMPLAPLAVATAPAAGQQATAQGA